jgi:hypothetical protein
MRSSGIGGAERPTCPRCGTSLWTDQPEVETMELLQLEERADELFLELNQTLARIRDLRGDIIVWGLGKNLHELRVVRRRRRG